MGRHRAMLVAVGCAAGLLLAACSGSPSTAGPTSNSAGTAGTGQAAAGAGSSGTAAAPASGGAAGMLPASVKSAGTIIAGAELTVPPMIFFESDGTTMTGVNYDLAQAMGAELGVKFEFKQFAFPGLQPALTSGKINVIFDVINDTKEREKQFDFIDYVTAGNTLLLPAGNPDNVQSLADMCGHTMSTVQGSVQIKLVQQASSDCTTAGKDAITIKQYPSAAAARLQVQNGKATAFIGNTPILLYQAKTANGGKTFSAVPISGEKSYYGIALAKSDTQLRDALVAALKQTMADGTYTKILDKYGLAAIALPQPIINGATS